MTRLAVPSAISYLVTGERKRSFVKHQAECSRCRKTGARTVRDEHSPKCLRASALGLTRSVANTCERLINVVTSKGSWTPAGDPAKKAREWEQGVCISLSWATQ